MAIISAEAVSRRLRQGDDSIHLLDIRPADEFDEWHIPASQNVDVYADLKANPEDAIDALQSLPSGPEIVTVCGVGSVSETATTLLREMGYDAKTLEDGLRGWSRVHEAARLQFGGPGELIQVARPGTGCLSYVLYSGGEAAVIDPSQYVAEYTDRIEGRGAKLAAVLETHAHADHLSGATSMVADHDVPHYLHPHDSGALKTTTRIDDGDELGIGDVTLRIVHTPGHTPGSVAVAVADGVILTGDTLFLDSVGRPDLDGGSADDVRRRTDILYDSLQRLQDYPGDVRVAPAHDAGTPHPPTTATLSTVRDRNDLLGANRSTFIDAVTERLPDTPPNHDRIKRVNTGREPIDPEEAHGIELGPNRCAAE